MNSKNKISGLHRLLLSLTDKINLKRSDKYVALSSLSIYDTSKNKRIIKTMNLKYNPQSKNKRIIKTMNLKYNPQHEVKNLIYLMDRILYQTLTIILSI